MCKTVKDHYGINDEKLIELIETCFAENPLNLKSVEMYGDFSKIRKAIPILLGKTVKKAQPLNKFSSAY